MKVIAALTLISSAAAFAPAAQQSQSSSALAAKPFADALGAQAPVSCLLWLKPFVVLLLFVQAYSVFPSLFAG